MKSDKPKILDKEGMPVCKRKLDLIAKGYISLAEVSNFSCSCKCSLKNELSN